MLRDIDKQLILEEMDKAGRHIELKPIDFSPFKILNHYNIFECTMHWYDSDAKECDQCEMCAPPNYCDNCEIWEQWRNSDERLKFNTWIDVYGAGIWGMTQKQCDKFVRRIFEGCIYKDGMWRERLFYYKPEHDPNFIYLFYYNRDRDHYDYWFIFKKIGV